MYEYSWLSAGLVFFLLLLFPIRKIIQGKKPEAGSFLAKCYVILRKIHIIVGIVAIPVVLMHCRATAEISGLNSACGAIALIILVLLAVSYFSRKSIGAKWKTIHRILAVVLSFVLVYHCFIEFAS